MSLKRLCLPLQLLLLLLLLLLPYVAVKAIAIQAGNLVSEEGFQKDQKPSTAGFRPGWETNPDVNDLSMSPQQAVVPPFGDSPSSLKFEGEKKKNSLREAALPGVRKDRHHESSLDTSKRSSVGAGFGADLGLAHFDQRQSREEEALSNYPEEMMPFFDRSVRGHQGEVPRKDDTKAGGWGETSKALIKDLCNVEGNKTTCYEHGASICYCQGGLADCSGRPYRPNISYAPKLPAGVKCLIFRHNIVHYLIESFFHNVSNFEVIDFSYSDVRYISKRTFQIFEGNLTYLILNYNLDLKYKYIENILKFPPSRRLDLTNIGLKGKDMPKNFFLPFSNISTKEFYFDFNYFPTLDLTQFAALKNVMVLSFENSSIANVVSGSLPKLTTLVLENNVIFPFPESCNAQEHHTASFFPRLKMLYLNSNNISKIPSSSNICLPSVRLLNLKKNNISSLPSSSLVNFPCLKVLYLDEMLKGISHVGANAVSSNTLIELHMSRNKLDFSSPSVHLNLFQGCPKLKVLYLSHNNMANVKPSSFSDLLSIPSLQHLYLSSCGLPFVPTEGLSQLTNLRKLYLYVNKIKSLPEAAFDSMTSLKYLYLHQNQIGAVRQNSFSQDTRNRLVKIDLSANTFQCNCDILWFKQWLTSATGSKQFVNFPKGYPCANIPGKLMIDFSVSRQACYFSRNTYIIFVVCLSIMLIAFLLFTILFRYRWHFRLALYAWRHGPAYRRLEEDDVDYQFDVFILHCNDDEEFVLDNLLEKVENRWGHRAFVHERNFQPGGHILDNIRRAIKLSRCTLVVLTSSFARSQWCNAELKMCQHYVIEHDLPSLLVLQMEPIEMCDMTQMLAVMRNTITFLEWPADGGQEEALFWQRLERCLGLLRGRQRPQRLRAAAEADA